MKIRNMFVRILALLIALPLTGTVAPAVTIEVIDTFDYPGTGNLTFPQKLNDRGLVVGVVIDATGVARGFLRNRNNVFSETWVEPNDTGNLTQGRGINNNRIICGEYLDGTTGTFHGYFHSHNKFREFDLADSTNTIPLGINNAGDFAGSVVLNDGTQQAFVSLGGNVTVFAIQDAIATLAYSLNASDQSVGYYLDADGVTTHGYLRDSDGTLTFPIDPAGSTGTVLFDNNDSNWVVGRYVDGALVTHGLFFVTPDDIITFDYPGAAGFTSLNGINADGYICGRYVDAAGLAHGFLAIVNLDGSADSNRAKSPAAVKPARPALEALRPGAPAL